MCIRDRSMFYSHRGGWRWQETRRVWTCLQSWWCCTTTSCLIWPLLPLLRQSWCRPKSEPLLSAGAIFAQGCSQVLETGCLLQLLAIHANICTDVVHAVGHDLALFCADFHSICWCSVYESVCEVLKFPIAATHRINVFSKSSVAYGSSTNGDGFVVVMEFFLHGLLLEKISCLGNDIRVCFLVECCPLTDRHKLGSQLWFFWLCWYCMHIYCYDLPKNIRIMQMLYLFYISVLLFPW